MSKRYFFDQDCSCHWYLIPDDKKKEWYEWSNLDFDDPENWNKEPPEGAIMMGCGPSLYTFTDPREEK